jgi:hypothetical protein
MDNEEFRRIMDSFDERIRKALKGKKQYVIYSAYSYHQDMMPIDNLEDIAFHGKIQIVHKHDRNWDDENTGDWVSPILLNPTWLDLCVAANSMIKHCGDTHHIFLEKLELTHLKSGVQIAKFWMGS